MSNIFLTKSTIAGPPVCSEKTLISGGAVTLTSSYVQTTDCAVVQGWQRATIWVKYVKGSETNALLLPVASSDGGTTWEPVTSWAIPSAGVSEGTKDEKQLTPANFSATDYVQMVVEVSGFALLALQYKYSGGSAPGAVTTYVSGQIVPVYK